ncbi:ATP-binding cassette domain-containing protein [Streptomyces sp. NBC_01483]|uniref:ATP-binding cassette domain-containing protein n=1 Tax=Streptomyces sp. NBC_01483 TaxID=2903883 RepID=UPI002E32852B|nr:ATP-binding cassette domain-containing protein [Streptomyces sp. NBC_01483]
MNTNEQDDVIEVTDLRRVYGGDRRARGDFEAVRGITFSVGRGELFALLGTNGAGKTSTVELLEGLAPPAGGRVRVLGHDPYEERAAVRPRIGVMLQEGGFPSELTVAETVRMWAGCTSGARPTVQALEMVGLTRRSGVRVKQLSGGEKRRLDLALALLGRPEVLFSGFFTFTSAFSVWLLNAVYELDEARETRARLAVAEERLRFGRDLHDVMGRNLAVVALKSELAVQLARRGRPEAVEQMVEVQRIARETQREVREVVRGYREADLRTELAGAQGVLTAAGIDCEVSGPVPGLPTEIQSALGWVVREATTNVLRHGDAGRCAVSLRVAEGRVTLTVENDGAPGPGTGTGAGTRPGAAEPGRGSGLAGLRERLGEVDGVLRAGPAGGDLFRLTAEVPLPPDSIPEQAPAPEPGGSPRPVPRPVSEVTS